MPRTRNFDQPSNPRSLASNLPVAKGGRSNLALVFSISALGVVFLSSSPSSADQVTQSHAEAERVSCGPRVVFSIARRWGYQESYESVRRRMHLTADGTTMKDIAATLNDIGVPCKTRRLDPTQLLTCPVPFIVHLQPFGKGGADGHYLIVSKIGMDGVETFDPYTDHVGFWKWSQFSDWWSGYAIIPEPSLATRISGFAPATVLVIHLLAFLGLVGSIGGVWRMLPVLSHRSRLVAWTSLFTIGEFLVSPTTRASEPLRANSNDGFNAAAILGGIYGSEVTPGRPIGGKECRTLEDARSCLAAYGVASSIRRVVYDDLYRTGPCIIPMRSGTNGIAHFYVLINLNSEHVTVAIAGPLFVTTIPVDEFRRKWNGLALVPSRGDSWAAYPAAALGAAVIPVLSYAFGRRGRRAATQPDCADAAPPPELEASR